MEDAESLRLGGLYAVLTPDECVEMARSNGGLRLHPLMDGLSPDLAWESLELVASKELTPARRTGVTLPRRMDAGGHPVGQEP